MARKKTPDGRRNGISAKFSDAELAEVDAARGTTGRGTWLREAALAYLRSPRRKPTQVRGGREAPAKASPVPEARQRCPHPGKRVIGGWCAPCDHMIEPGGYWRMP